MRTRELDILRGYAVALMVLDHVLHVLTIGRPLRLTLTRLALPLFMGVSGWLLASRGRPSARRVAEIAAAALVATCVQPFVGMGVPEILTLYLLALVAWPVLIAAPVSAVALGVVQAVYLPFLGPRSYEPGLVIAWVALGVLGSRQGRPVPQLPVVGAGVASWLGRHALAVYLVHLAALAVVVQLLPR